MFRRICTFALIIAASACVATEPVSVSPAPLSPSDLALAEGYIRETLRDPDGARFRRPEGFRTGQGDRIVCGEYNATNGFGGYVGYTPYYIRIRGDFVDIAHFGNGLGAVGCDKARSGEVQVAVSG
ncbi:hypothetical protein [Jannaschia sp. 2305UL9-9]|uniref:hypothetical protein n=1 Tax=Jannaschia sp. 2305UL9-9 TaxID=3121638 RepID=UPI003527D002